MMHTFTPYFVQVQKCSKYSHLFTAAIMAWIILPIHFNYDSGLLLLLLLLLLYLRNKGLIWS